MDPAFELPATLPATLSGTGESVVARSALSGDSWRRPNLRPRQLWSPRPRDPECASPRPSAAADLSASASAPGWGPAAESPLQESTSVTSMSDRLPCGGAPSPKHARSRSSRCWQRRRRARVRSITAPQQPQQSSSTAATAAAARMTKVSGGRQQQSNPSQLLSIQARGSVCGSSRKASSACSTEMPPQPPIRKLASVRLAACRWQRDE
eukprot:scaffold81378_cov48-Phaeocystis_antarctica.AAC.1